MRKVKAYFLTMLIAAAALLPMSGCASSSDGKLKLPDVPLENIVAVSVVSSVGNITVLPGSGSLIRIESSYSITAGDRDRRKLLAENVLVTTDTSDPSVLTILSRLNNNAALKEDELAQINLTIQVPEAVKSVVIQSENGDISVENMTCTLTVVNNNGTVRVKDTVLTGKNRITNVVGDISVKLKNIDSAQEIQLSADVGDIVCNVPKRASYTVIKEELSGKGDTWKNKDGKTKITLSTKVGKISFQK